MATGDADDLVAFDDITVIKSTAAALLCRIGGRSVWLPRWHISGKLWCVGDRGRLFIRRWIARDRKVIDAQGAAIEWRAASIARLPVALRLVRRDRNPSHAK